MAKKGKRLVLCNATAGKEGEFNKWYDEVHAKELLALKGYSGITRYKVDAQIRPQANPPEFGYMTIWHFDDVDTANASSMAARPNLTMSDSLDFGRTVMLDMEEIFHYKK
jgi:hypothetical protein